MEQFCSTTEEEEEEEEESYEEEYSEEEQDLCLWEAEGSSLWGSDLDEQQEQFQSIFLGEVQIIAVSRIYFEKYCLICEHYIESEDEIVQCCCCQTLQLTKECDERLSAKLVVKTEGGRRITVWAYDDLRKILKCGIEDPKKALLNCKFSAYLKL